MRTHHSLGSLFRFLAWLSVAAAAVIGLSVGILIAWTHTAAGDAWITRRVEAIVRETVPGLAVQRVHLILPASLDGFGVSVRDTTGVEAIWIAQLHARIDLRALLSRKLRVEALALFEPRVTARQPARQGLNLAALVRNPDGRQGAARAPWTFEIHDFVLNGGVLDWQSSQGHQSARDVRATGSVLVDGGQVRATLRLWACGQAGSLAPTASLDAAGVISRDRIDLRINHLSGEGLLAQGPLLLQGTVHGPYDALDLDLFAKLPPVADAHVSGRLGLAGGLSYDLLVDAARISPGTLVATWPAASLTFAAKLRGTGVPFGTHPVAALNAAFRQSEIVGIGPLQGRLEGNIEGRNWRLRELVVKGPGLALLATGSGQDRRLALDLRGQVARVQGLPGLPRGLRGRAQVHAHVRLDLPSTIDFLYVWSKVNDLSYQGHRVGEAELELTADGPLALPKGQVHMKARDVQWTSEIGRVDQLNLQAAFGKRLVVAGSASGAFGQARMEASGTLTPSSADINLRRFSARHGSYSVVLQEPASLQWRKSHFLAVKNLHLAALEGSIQAEGEYRQRTHEITAHVVANRVRVLPSGRAANLDLHLALASMRMQLAARLGIDSLPPASATVELPVSWAAGAALPALAVTGPVAIHLDVAEISVAALPQVIRSEIGLRAGQLALAADISGDVAHPQARIRASLRDGAFRSIDGIAAVVTAGVGGESVDVQATASLHGATVAEATGQIRTDLASILVTRQFPAGSLQAEVNLPAVDMSQLLGKAVTGRVAGHAQLGGTLANPTVELDLATASAEIAGVSFAELAAHGEYRASRWQASARASQLAGGSLNAGLTGERYQVLDGHLQAKQVNISFLQTLVPDLVAASGLLDASLKLDSPHGRASVSGTLALGQGRFVLPGWPAFEQVDLRASLASDHIQIEKLATKMGRGKIALTGRIGLDGVRLTSLWAKAQAESIPISTAAVSGATFDGDVEATGEVESSRLDATMRVTKGRVEIPRLESGRKLQSLSPMQGVVFVGEPTTAPSPETRAVLLPQSVHLVVQADNFLVHGKDIQAACNVKLSLDDNGEKTQLAGQITTQWGSVFLFGNHYTVNRANLRWNGSENLDPALDIQLFNRLPEVMVIISVRGTASKPDLSFSSDPPTYGKADLVSLVLTGRLPDASAGGRGDLSGSALSAISTAIVGNLAERMAPLGGGVVRVQSVSATSTQSAQAAAIPQAAGPLATRVEIGKTLTDRVYVGYAHIFGAVENENSNEGRFEYRMSRSWILQSEYGDAGVGGFDLLWTTRY